MTSLHIARTEWKRVTSSRLFRAGIVVVALIPLLYGALYLWAFWDPYANLDQIPVAIVNLDEPHEVDGTTLQADNGAMPPPPLPPVAVRETLPAPAQSFRPGESLAVHIYKIYGEGSPEAQQIVWGIAALLMICVLLFNVVARIVGKQLARKMTAE